MAIRYDNNLNKNIARIVKNYNAKISRLGSMSEFLPEKVSVIELKGQFVKRSELLNRLKELESFSKRGSETLIETAQGYITQYEADIIRRRSIRTKTRLTKLINRQSSRSTSAPYAKSVYLVNLQRRREMLNRNYLELNRQQREYYLANLDVNPATQDQSFFNFFFENMELTAKQFGTDESKVAEIKRKLSKLRPDQLYEAYKLEPILQFQIENGIDSPNSFKNVEDYEKFLSRRITNEPDLPERINATYDDILRNIDAIIEKYSTY